MANVECVWPVAATLGEGALWSPEEQAMWFVDIEGRSLHHFTPATGERRSWPAPDRPGFVALCSGGGLVVGLAKSLSLFSPADGSFRHLMAIEQDRPANRLNDGSVGPDGALWFGSKNDPDAAATGAWHRWDGSGPPTMIDDGYVVTNGPAFSPDGDTMYFCDSTERRILARSVSPAGLLGDVRVFAAVADGEGYPDGLAVDDAGDLWVALFAGGGLRRYTPEGEHVQSIALPSPNVTKPAFGGPDGLTLFVTTARIGLSTAELAAHPLAGGLFAVRVDTPGPAPAPMVLA